MEAEVDLTSGLDQPRRSVRIDVGVFPDGVFGQLAAAALTRIVIGITTGEDR
jgi:hypothetical protein